MTKFKAISRLIARLTLSFDLLMNKDISMKFLLKNLRDLREKFVKCEFYYKVAELMF